MSKAIYKTRIEVIDVAGMQIKLHRVTNIDELYCELLKKDSGSIDIKDERIPYWAELWPSAIAVSRFIAKNKLVNEKSFVHEIGCGLALPAIVCGKLGAQVLISDYVNDPIDVALKNWNLNLNTKPLTQLMDWRMPDALKCDVLIAADVAYEKRMFGVLVKAFKELINPRGKILFSEPNRELTRPFYNLLGVNGFKTITTQQVVRMNEFDHKINVSVIEKL